MQHNPKKGMYTVIEQSLMSFYPGAKLLQINYSPSAMVFTVYYPFVKLFKT